MKSFITSIFLLIVATAISQQDKRLKGVENELTAILEATKAPSFAVAVVKGNNIIYAKGFGMSDIENNRKADANTLYAIGSCTKAFTSGLLGILQAEDKLSLDDNPRKYLPNLEFSNNDLNNNLIIKDLISHRTGLPRHDFAWYLFPTNDTDSLIARIKYQKPFTGIRQQWYYNNFMFLVQGAIAENITGESWQDNIRNKFLKPLGMSRSNVTIQEMKDSDNRAVGYQLNKDKEIEKTDYYDIASMSAAGSINSSVNDMANWLIMWINKGKFNEKEILPEPYVMDAISSHSIVSPTLPDDEHPDMFFTNYGYGWFLNSYRGHYRVQHGGNIDGFSANTAFYPSDSLGIVVLTNQNGSPLPSLVRNTIADRMLGTERTDWAKDYLDDLKKAEESEQASKADETSSKVHGTKPSHNLQEYTGKYTNEGYGNFEIVIKNDSLFANFKLETMYLDHYHYDIFEPYFKTENGFENDIIKGLFLNFSTNEGGDISSLKMKVEPTLDAIVFTRQPNSIEVEDNLIDKYVGEFELASITIKIYTKDDSVLYAFVQGQPEYELLATAKHKFSFKSLEGFKIEYLEDENGDFNEINVIQPNGTFKAVRKE